jgi:hypothetical protein
MATVHPRRTGRREQLGNWLALLALLMSCVVFGTPAPCRSGATAGGTHRDVRVTCSAHSDVCHTRDKHVKGVVHE